MGEKKRGAPVKERPAKSGSRAPVIAGVLLLVAALGIGGYWWTIGGAGGPVRGAKPAIPRVPRPATLSPVLFTGYAARGYQVANELRPMSPGCPPVGVRCPLRRVPRPHSA
ncbi:MAG: hypothetical protein HY803_06965 [candidate division NC10 bacterium]|nr:hypothetical protein [candidate division NC10 bacterium]